MFTEVTAPLWAIFTLLTGWLLYRWHAEQALRARQNFYIQLIYGAAAVTSVTGFLNYVADELGFIKKKVDQAVQAEATFVDPAESDYIKDEINHRVQNANARYIEKHDQNMKKLYNLIKTINEKLDDVSEGSSYTSSEDEDPDLDILDDGSASSEEALTRKSHRRQSKTNTKSSPPVADVSQPTI